MKIFRLLVILISLSAHADFLHELPSESTILEGYANADTVEMRLSEMPLSPIEGVWQMAAEGATFVIERAENSTDLAPAQMRIVIIRSPRRSVRPGTVVGHVVTTAKPAVYEARLYTSFAPRTGLISAKAFSLEVKDDMLVFTPFKSPIKVNLLRLLPYMYRRAISTQTSRPEGLNGALRLYPRSAAHPLTPVYL